GGWDGHDRGRRGHGTRDIGRVRHHGRRGQLLQLHGRHGQLLRHRAGIELGVEPRGIGRLLMTAGTAGPATPARPEASASRHALATEVQVTVTDASQLTAARGMLEADLAAVDLACSRFRPDSEIMALDRATAGAGGAGREAGGGTAADAGPVEVSPLL